MLSSDYDRLLKIQEAAAQMQTLQRNNELNEFFHQLQFSENSFTLSEFYIAKLRKILTHAAVGVEEILEFYDRNHASADRPLTNQFIHNAVTHLLFSNIINLCEIPDLCHLENELKEDI